MQPSPLSERAIDRERMSRDPAPSLCRAASQEALGIGPDCRRLGFAARNNTEMADWSLSRRVGPALDPFREAPFAY